MKRLSSFVGAVFVAALLVFSGQDRGIAADSFWAVVRQCSDGDTLVLDTGQRVRLAGIDTPEKASGGTPAQYFSREAHAFTRERVQGVRVHVEPFSGESRDRHKRLVAEIRLPDGNSLNELILRNGMGFFYAHKDVPADLADRLRTAQREALDKRIGCWGKLLTEPQAQKPYIGNRNSKRFFTPACLRNTSISKRNQIVFTDLKTAFEQGYSPARPCGIWPLTQ